MAETQRATFGAGCFWGVEVAFRQIERVVAAAVGYQGGSYQNPSYQDVRSGHTGHAEVVKITFVGELPKTATGKLKRYMLRKDAALRGA